MFPISVLMWRWLEDRIRLKTGYYSFIYNWRKVKWFCVTNFFFYDYSIKKYKHLWPYMKWTRNKLTAEIKITVWHIWMLLNSENKIHWKQIWFWFINNIQLTFSDLTEKPNLLEEMPGSCRSKNSFEEKHRKKIKC